MRALRALVVVGLGGFFAMGCGSSNTTDGGTTGASTTGGTTGMSTTGGTTTGGTSGLPPGSPCTANGQCYSDQCGIAGTGNCCSNLCVIGTTCGATGCDGTGACTYPVSGTACGTATCSGGMFTSSACNGAGACAAGTATACPNHLACNSGGTACLTICTVLSDCASGFYCNAGTCTAQQATGACTENDACTSGFCGTSGSGDCCTAQCMATTDPACDATSCDATSGACVYPAGTACGSVTCTGGALTAFACSATGTCVPGTPVACPNNLACNSGGTACLTSCTVLSDCASGFYCNAGACVAQQATGACTVKDVCISGVCGTNGTGNCCTAACSIADPVCGATACDDTGACVYPAAATSCGPPPSCSGSTLTASTCNGDGTCIANGGAACPNNLNCNSAGTGCLTKCARNTDCVGSATNFCDTSTGGCCPAIPSATNMFIDSATGSDATACCGYGTAGDCQTLTRAMGLANGANSLGGPIQYLTLVATVNGGGGDWANNNEHYPIPLGWGITLSATGVYFTDTGGNSEIFDVALQPGETAPGTLVTIQGASGPFGTTKPTIIGSDTTGNLTNDTASIVVEANETLNVSFVDVYEGAGNTGINVQTGATLDLDQGHTGGALNLGPFPGGNLPNGNPFTATKLGTGILCNGTVSDSNSGAPVNSVVSVAQDISIDAEDDCSLSLTNYPVFGWPASGGFTNAGNGCTPNPTPMDRIGVQVNGNATVSLGGATITCMSSWGIASTNTGKEAFTPTITFSNYAVIENCAAAGIYATAGAITVQSGFIDHNFIGVDMENDSFDTPSVTLNDGTKTNNTSVMCNSNQETGGANPGIDVYNNSTGNVAADYVYWDRWYDPNGGNTATTTDIFDCDATFTCQCEVLDFTSTAACKTAAGGDDMDLVLGGFDGQCADGHADFHQWRPSAGRSLPVDPGRVATPPPAMDAPGKSDPAGGDDMDLVLGGSTDSTPSGFQTSTNGALASGGCN